MIFPELLKLLSAETHLDINEAIHSGGCTIRFDNNIDITFEYHDVHVYLFSPVMRITQVLPDDFFASLLQIHLFGVATSRCWFGYDAGGQRVLLFCLFDLDSIEPDKAMERIETLVEQVQYWQENLPKIGQLSSINQGAFSATQHFQSRR